MAKDIAKCHLHEMFMPDFLCIPWLTSVFQEADENDRNNIFCFYLLFSIFLCFIFLTRKYFKTYVLFNFENITTPTQCGTCSGWSITFYRIKLNWINTNQIILPMSLQKCILPNALLHPYKKLILNINFYLHQNSSQNGKLFNISNPFCVHFFFQHPVNALLILLFLSKHLLNNQLCVRC